MAVCELSGESFDISERDLDFYDRVSPVVNGTKFPVPVPRLSPKERKRRRLAFRNERTLFRSKSSLTGRPLVTVFCPESPYKVYHSEEWWGDEWEALDKAPEFDFSRPFFEQFGALLKTVPLEALFVRQSENCEFTNLAGFNKDCYLIFNSPYNQNCLFGRGLTKTTDCMDLYYCSDCELCYECVNCHDHCYDLRYSQNCSQCVESDFLYGCIGCQNCFGCTNQHHKQNYILNKPATKDEVKRLRTEVFASQERLKAFQEQFEQLKLESLHRANHNLNCEGCTGDYLANSKGCLDCFEAKFCEDCSYCDSIHYGKDVYDAMGAGLDSELQYETVAVGLSNRVGFCMHGFKLADAWYSASCHSCEYIFGCAALKNKQYCIFNKQYTKDEYFQLLPKLIEHMHSTGEWGQFFHPSISPIAYNHSVAHEYYPLTEEQALKSNYQWSHYQFPEPSAADAVRCQSTGKLFKHVKAEENLAKRLRVMLASQHPDHRHYLRTILRGPKELQSVDCSQCGQKTVTAITTPGYQIACEECYRSAVF